jgi:hypothetical protein
MNCIFRASLFAATHFPRRRQQPQQRLDDGLSHGGVSFRCWISASKAEAGERHKAAFHHFSFRCVQLFLAGGGKLVRSPPANQLSAIIYSEY